MIDEPRLRQTFLDLLAFNSPPGREREVSRYCADVLREAGFVCQTDPAGNIIAQKSGSVPEAPRIFFSAHTDTVEPTEGLVVREEDGVFRTSGDTILGADDKAGVAAILEAVRTLDDRDLPHGDLQVILSTGEEIGLLGARALASEVVAGSLGFVFDAGGPVGHVITSAPIHDAFDVRVIGRPAHAGNAPERGVSALQIACRAIAAMRLGRIDPETTANLGILRGGTATNVVPAEAVLKLEARSRNPKALETQVRHMRECLEEAAAFYGGEVKVHHEREYSGYVWSPDDLPVRIAAEAWRSLGLGEPTLRAHGGGSDANVYNARGIPAVVLSCGYLDAHTTEERIALSELVTAARWAVAVAMTAAEAG